MKNRFSLLLVLSLFLISCTSTKAENIPSWFLNQYDSTYTVDNYMCTVGSGSTKEEAEENAKIALSQVFNTSIKNATVTFDNDTSSTLNSRGYIDTSVDNLIGIKTINSYVNADGTFFVRVALDKRLAGNKIRELITPKNSEISSLLNNDNESDFAYLQDLLRARKLALGIQNYFDQLSVLESATVTSPLISINKKIASLKQNLSLSVEIKSEDSFTKNQLEKAVETMVIDSGISITDEGATLVVEYVSSTAPPKDGLYQCSFTLKVQLVENSNTVLSFDKNSRAIAISEDSAKVKATEKATEIIKGELF